MPGLTNKRIMELAARPGNPFRVSWRYSDEKLYRRCCKLRSMGFLWAKRGHGETFFAATKLGLKALEAGVVR